MIEEWATNLSDHGFDYDPEDPTVLQKSQGFFQFSMTDMQQRVQGVPKTRVRLCLSIMNRFREPERSEAVLFGYLCEDGVVIAHYGRDGRWWLQEERDRAWEALLAFGLPWFSAYGAPTRLIEYFETGPDEPEQAEAVPVATRLIRRVLGSPRAEVPRSLPPVFHHYLSLLYSEFGNQSMARQHATEYMGFLASRPADAWAKQIAEAQRVLQHLGGASD